MRQLFLRATLVALFNFSAAEALLADDLSAVLRAGPRVAGSAAGEQARGYLEGQFHSLGFQTRREDFTYSRFDDLGSALRLEGKSLSAHALQGSAGGEVSAGLVRVPGVGQPGDFAGASVRGKIAVVERGQIPFGVKAKNALQAGAKGLVIVNNEGGDFQGTLGDTVSLPVLGVSPEVGRELREGASLTLSAHVQAREVRGVNLVAFKAGLEKPALLFGAHLDSVTGAPGANDNLSGSVAVLELARRTADKALGKQSYFVLFDGEEDGLRGSRAFVQDNGALVKDLRAMFNFDMVGVNVTPLAIGGSETLTALAEKVAPELREFQDSGGSDHASFTQAGVPALFFHRGIDPNYHKPGDVVADPALIAGAVDEALKVAGAVLGAPAVR